MKARIPRRIILLGLVALMTTTGVVAVDVPADLKSKGTIKIGVLVDFPPFGITNASNQPDGFDIELAKLIASRMGLQAEIVPVTGPNRIPNLLTGRLDMLVAGLAITPERQKQVAFSAPYASGGHVIYGRRDKTLTGPPDLKAATIGVPRGSAQDIALTRIAPEGTNIRRFDDDASSVQALITGQVDAIAVSTVVLPDIAKLVPSGKFDTKFDLQKYVLGIAMRKEQTGLVKAVDEVLGTAKRDGSLNAIHKKWLNTDVDLTQLKVPGQ